MASILNAKPLYRSTKRWDYAFSCAFRQWRAESHCRLVHGYALSVELVFATHELDVRNWVVDFGSLKNLKGQLEDIFDHKTVVADDDPGLAWFQEADKMGLLDLVTIPAGGCERFAEFIYDLADTWLGDAGYKPRCWLESAQVWEHPGNSAIHKPM